MNQMVKTEETRALSPSQQFRHELEKMGDQFAAALPAHIKPEKFQRVVMTAVLSDPDILKADRKTLMEAAIRAAQDGLLPDKREGAFVVYNTKVKVDGKDVWIKAVQWMPMVGGIIKRVHQSGDIKMLTARVVYGGDHFRTWIDDTGEHIEYEPAEEQDTSVVRRVFAMATTVDGAVYVEPLSAKDVEKIRSVSKQKDRGPWADWWEEMAKKSAIRRLAKRLPLSVDIHDLIQRDNGLYDLSQEPEQRTSVLDRLKAAKNITPEPQDEREGFSRDFVHAETESQPTGSNDDFSDEEPTLDLSPQDDAGSSSLASTEEAGESPASKPAPASSTPSRDPETDVLIRYAKDVLPRAGNPETTGAVLSSIEKRWAEEIGKLSENGRAKAQGIAKSMRAIFNGNASLDAAIEYFAEVLECETEDLING